MLFFVLDAQMKQSKETGEYLTQRFSKMLTLS